MQATNPSFPEIEMVGPASSVWRLTGLQKEFKDSLRNLVRPWLKILKEEGRVIAQWQNSCLVFAKSWVESQTQQ